MFYITKQSSDNITPASFLERNLKGRVATEVSDSDISAFNTGDPKIAFSIVMGNLPRYMQAQYTQQFRRMVDTPSVYNVFPHVLEEMAIESPVLAIKFYGKGDALTYLKEQGMMEDSAQKNVWLGRPSFEQFRNIVQNVEVSGVRLSLGRVGIDGYFAFIWAWKGLSMFSTASEAGVYGKILLDVPEIKEEFFQSGTVTSMDGTFGTSFVHEVQEKTTGEDGNEMEVMKIVNREFIQIGVERDALVYQPIASLRGHPWRSPRDKVDMMGHLFPYFDGMLLPDKTAIGHIFFTLFANGIGDDPETISSMSKRLRDGFKQLAYTRSGMVLSHAYKGVELSLQSRAKFVVLHERGSYLGFLLQGDTAVIDCGRVHLAMNSKELQKEVDSISQHENAIAEIKVLLERVIDEEGDHVIQFDDMDFESSRRLHFLLSEKVPWDNEDLVNSRTNLKEKVLDQVERLRFGEGYMEINEENILSLVSMLASGRYPSKSSGIPFYLSRATALSKNSIIRALAAFGPLAPSICVGSMKKTVARPSAKDPLLEKDSSGRTPLLPYIPIYSRPIISAAGEWRRLANTATMGFMTPKKGQTGFTDRAAATIIISDYDSKVSVLDDIKRFCHPENDGAGPAPKRTAEGDGTDREAKRMRVESSSSALKRLAKGVF